MKFQNILKRFTSENEIFRYEVLPSKDVTINSNLKDFVEICSVSISQATGMPVVQIEAGKIVVDSFVYAFIFSFFVTFLYLLIIFRKIYYVLQCIGSLLIALTLLIFFNDNF